MSKYILVVEDSRLFCGLISKRIAREFSYECLVCSTRAEAKELLKRHPDDILLAVLDLNLPDAPDGEVVEHVAGKKIPTIVVTGHVNDQIRDRILHLQVFDYIIKGPHALDLLCAGIRRYLRNARFAILIVDDSAIAREMTTKLLATQYFTVVEAGNGTEALRKLEADPSIKLVLTDYHMPEMDGFELISAIRTRHSMDMLGIIGLSARGNSLLSSQFLKRGANDFLSKPYFEEELIWRVNQNIEMLEYLATQRTRQDSLESRLEESKAMAVQQEKLAAIGQLAAGVAHEINNPLGFISSNLNALKKYISRTETYLKTIDCHLPKLPDILRSELGAVYSAEKIELAREDLPDLVEDCLDGTERMRKIVLGLKSFARRDDDEEKLADINQCIEEAITISWNELKYKAEVERDFVELPQTCCNPHQLTQVFIILLVNAAHAIEHQGNIRIVTRRAGEGIKVAISDTGCGIPPENLEKIFEPFFTTKKQGQGTGLGMGIAREIVERHKGTIEVVSEPGSGTCFTLRFPLRRVPQPRQKNR